MLKISIIKAIKPEKEIVRDTKDGVSFKFMD
jgi:hypothetical protein